MNKVIILGSGAAPGVPTITKGWGKCNPLNPKNRRSRAGIYVEIDNNKLLIDTSADLRNQLLENAITQIDAVLYTHIHADHVMGIDDLRSFGYHKRDKEKSLPIYLQEEHLSEIYHRFDYVLPGEKHSEITNHPLLKPNIIEYGKTFAIGQTEIMPLEFAGHPVITTGFSFNQGKLVIIPDYKIIPQNTLSYLQKINVDVLIMPLTVLEEASYHADMNINLKYIEIIKPKRVFFTHMGPECDYDEVLKNTPSYIKPAYDNMIIEL